MDAPHGNKWHKWQKSQQEVFVEHYDAGSNKVWKSYFCVKVKVKVTDLERVKVTDLEVERATLVGVCMAKYKACISYGS